MGLIAVEPGQIAAVITTLEMRARPRPAPMPPSPLRLVRWDAPPVARYRALFRRVGEPWLWYSRLVMADDQLAALLREPGRSIHAVVDARGVELGLLELDAQVPGECLIDFLALVPELVGKGHGRWLLAHALALAWRPGVARVVVNTSSTDHPHAMQVYRAAGLVPVARHVETFADPRLTGVLSPDAAPHVPMIGAAGSDADAGQR